MTFEKMGRWTEGSGIQMSRCCGSFVIPRERTACTAEEHVVE